MTALIADPTVADGEICLAQVGSETAVICPAARNVPPPSEFSDVRLKSRSAVGELAVEQDGQATKSRDRKREAPSERMYTDPPSAEPAMYVPLTAGKFAADAKVVFELRWVVVVDCWVVVVCPVVVGEPVVLLVGAAVPGEVVVVEATVVVASEAVCLDEPQAASSTTSDRRRPIFEILRVIVTMTRSGRTMQSASSVSSMLMNACEFLLAVRGRCGFGPVDVRGRAGGGVNGRGGVPHGGFCRPSSWFQSGAMAGTPTPPTSR